MIYSYLFFYIYKNKSDQDPGFPDQMAGKDLNSPGHEGQ